MSLWLLLLACAGDEPLPRDTAPICDATVLGSLPEDGEDVIGTNAKIVIAVEGRVTAEGARLLTAPAHPFSATVEDGRVTFSPDTPLTPGQPYEWTATICDLTAGAGRFTPRGLGEEVPPEDLVGRTFGVNLADATWVEPSNGGDLFAQLFGGLLLLGVQEVGADEVTVMGAVGEDIDGFRQQDPCYETIAFEAADFTRNPYLELGPAAFPLVVQGQDVVLHDLRLFGAFADGGEALGDASLSAQGDLRDLVGPDTASWCAQLAQFGLSCTECRSDGVPSCIDLLVADIRGQVVPGLRLQRVSEPAAECGQDSGRG